MLINLAVNVWCRSDSAFSRLCRIPWAVQKQRPVFSFLSAPGLVLQISNCSSVWRLRMGLFGCCSVGWHFPGSQACCCIKHSLLSGSSVVWRSDGPRGISVTNASSLSLKVRTNGVWGFFSSSCNIPPEETPLYRPFPTALFNNEWSSHC